MRDEGTLRGVAARLAVPPAPEEFSDHEMEELPDPAIRYLKAAIAQGTPLAQAARFRMGGSIKVGKRWLPFRGPTDRSPAPWIPVGRQSRRCDRGIGPIRRWPWRYGLEDPGPVSGGTRRRARRLPQRGRSGRRRRRVRAHRLAPAVRPQLDGRRSAHHDGELPA